MGYSNHNHTPDVAQITEPKSRRPIDAMTSGFAKGVAAIVLIAVIGTALVGAAAAEGWGLPLVKQAAPGMLQQVGRGGFLYGLFAGAQTGLAALFSGGPGLSLLAAGGAVGSYVGWRGNKRDKAVETVVDQNLELRQKLAAEYAKAQGQSVNVNVDDPSHQPPRTQEQYVNVNIPDPGSDPYFNNVQKASTCGCQKSYVADEEQRRLASVENCTMRGNPYA